MCGQIGLVTAGTETVGRLLASSAGRDERQYPNADLFDVRRDIDHHVSFGYGVHFCRGAALAQVGVRVHVEVLGRGHDDRVDARDLVVRRGRQLRQPGVRGAVGGADHEVVPDAVTV
jgi:cytochrome P450